MNLESLVLELYADTSRLDREVKAAVSRAANQIKKLERDEIEIEVDEKPLHDLNDLLDVKQAHIIETARVFRDNPLESAVSDASLVNMPERMAEGKKEEKAKDSSLFDEVNSAIEGGIKKAIGKAGDLLLAPFAGIGRGLFEGFGNEIAKTFADGVIASFDDSFDINLTDLGKQGANAVTESLFPQLKDRNNYNETLARTAKSTAQYPEIAKNLSAKMEGREGFSVEKEQLKEIEKAYQRIGVESVELVKSGKSKKLPSKQDVQSYGQRVVSKTQEIAEWSQWLDSVATQVNTKAKLYEETESSIDEIQKRLDSAINTNNYGEVKATQGLIETKKKELEKYKGDDFIDSLMDRLNELQGQSIQDKKEIVKNTEMPSLREYITAPMQSIGLAADKGMAVVSESIDEIKNDLVAFAVEAAKATVRGAIGAGKGAYKGLQAGEDMVFSLAPFGEAKKAKQIAQGVGKIAIPAAAFGAIGSLPGGHQLAELIVTLVKGALESGLNPLEAGLITNIAEAIRGVTGVLPNAVGNPLANSLIAEIEGAIHAVVGLMTGGGAEIGAAVIGGQGIRALAEGGIKTTGQVIDNALAPSDERSKYLEAAKESYNSVKTRFTGYLDRYQRIDEYIPMLPPAQQETARKGLKAVGALQTMYSGDAEWQKTSGQPFDLKRIGSKNDVAKIAKQKGEKAVDSLFNWIQDQYRNAVRALDDFEKSYSVLPQDDRQSPELIGIKAELSKRVGLFRDKARFFGRKLEKDPNRASDVVTTAQKVEVPDLGKIARTATKKANVSDIEQGLWEVGTAQAEGIGEAFTAKMPEVVENQVTEVAKGKKAIKKDNGIASPAKVWEDEIGKPLGQGVEVGAVKAIQEANLSIMLEVGKIVSSVGAKLEGMDKIIAPIMDDLSYLNAVKSGDMDTAASMFSSVAKTKGFDTEIYHGSPHTFNKFDKKKMGDLTGSIDSTMAFFGSSSPDVAKDYMESKDTVATNPKLYSLLLKTKDPLEVDYGRKAYDEDRFYRILSEAKSRDKDSLIVRNVYDDYGAVEGVNKGKLADTYGFFNPNQVKLSDPVIYDEKGRVVPLSSRFDRGADIRGRVADAVNLDDIIPIDSLADDGLNIVTSMVNSITRVSPELQATGELIGESLDDGTRKSLEMNSPSKLYIRHGKNTIISFEMGVEGELKRIKNTEIPVPELENQGYIDLAGLAESVGQMKEYKEIHDAVMDSWSTNLDTNNPESTAKVSDTAKPLIQEVEKLQQQKAKHSQVMTTLRVPTAPSSTTPQNKTLTQVTQLSSTDINPDEIQGYYKKPDITGLKSRLAKVTNEDDLAALRDDYYYVKNYLLGLRKQIAARLERELGVLASRPIESVNAKYDNLASKIDSNMQSDLEPIKNQKEKIKARFGKIRSRLTRERNLEIENAKLEDKFRLEQQELINAKYDRQLEMLTDKKSKAFERASELSLRQNELPKDEFLAQELPRIRQVYSAKVAKVNQQRSQDLQEFAPTLPAVRQKYESRLSGLDIRESREMMPLNAQESQIKGRYSGLKSEAEKRRQKELEQAQRYNAQMGALDTKLDDLASSFRQKTIQYAGKAADNIIVGTEEYYDNFLNSLKDELKDVLRLKGDEGDALIDQVLTYMAAGASTFSPGLMPAISAAPMMMPLIPTGLAALGIGNLIAPVIQRIDEALRVQEPIRQRFITLEGNRELGEQKQQQVMGIAQKYAIPVQPAVENFSQMAIAAQNTNLTATEMMDLFEGISASIKALGLSTQDADLIFMAYTQMLSKGKVSMEELRQQLGERFPPAMSIFAKALGTTTAGLDDLVSRGAVMTDQWVPKVTKVLKEDFGKAALEMGDNYANAINRLENINFSISKKFADTYGGLFTTMKNLFAGIIKLMDDNFKILNALAISGLIAVGASIAIGTTFILKTPAIANLMKGGTNLLLSTFKFSLKALTPFLIGTLADVLDDVLGADSNVFDNMSKGVTNFFTGIFSGIDQGKRNETGLGLFDPLQKISNPFESITEGVKGFVSSIPSGVVELTALVLMFEQVRVLGSMYIVPLFKDMAGAVWGWSKALTDAVFNMGTAKRTLGDLFGGTLLGVSRSGVLEKYKDDFVALRKEVAGGADINNKANLQKYKEARESKITAFQQRVIDDNPLAPPVSRRQAIQSLESELKALKQDMLSRVDRDPVIEYTKKRDALLKQRMRQESIARATMMAGSIALEAALAVGVLAFARGDFSNTLGGEINKGKKGILSAVESINNALKSMGNAADNAGRKLASIKLPSKGIQLDIRNLLDPTKDFKWDDLINKINKTLQTTKNPVIKFLLEPIYKGDEKQKVEKRIQDAQRLGLKEYYIDSPGLLPTMAGNQLLDNALDIERLLPDMKKALDNGIFDPNDLSQPIKPEFKAVFDEIVAIDAKVKSLGGQRVELAEINTHESRKQIGLLDKQINELLKERKDKVRPFIGLETGLKDAEATVKAYEDAIANENYPADAKQRLKTLLEPFKAFVGDLKTYFKNQDLLTLAQPLEDVWDRVVNKLQDVEFALMRVQNAQRVAFNKVQKDIYNNPQETPLTSQISVQKATLQDLIKQKDVLEKAYDSNYKSLQELLAVANIGDTSEKRAKIDELRKLVMDQESSISDLDLGIAKAQFDLKFNTSLEEEVIKTSRDIFNFNRSIATQLIGIQNQFRDYNRQLEDASINSAKMVRGLVESYNDLNWELENNILTVQNELLDAQDRLALTNLKIQDAQFDPGQDTIGKRAGSIILKLFESINGGESEKRRRLQEANQAQKEYTDTLRRVRDFEEQVLQERINQKRTLEDLTTGFQNLNQAVKDLVLQLNQSREDLIRNTKNQSGRDISGQLSAVPSVAQMGAILPPPPLPISQAIIPAPVAAIPQQASQPTYSAPTRPNSSEPSYIRYGAAVVPQQRQSSPPRDLYELTNKYGGNSQDFIPSITQPYPQIQLVVPQPKPQLARPQVDPVSVNVNIPNSQQEYFAKLIVAESGGESLLGQALTARSVLNRQRVNNPRAYMARSNSLTDLINAPNQYQPVSTGAINKPRTPQQMAKANQAISLASNDTWLKSELEKLGYTQGQIKQLLNATGFRTPSAFNDPSQNHNRVRFGGHIFNSDKVGKQRLQSSLGESEVLLASGLSDMIQPILAQSSPSFMGEKWDSGLTIIQEWWEKLNKKGDPDVDIYPRWIRRNPTPKVEEPLKNYPATTPNQKQSTPVVAPANPPTTTSVPTTVSPFKFVSTDLRLLPQLKDAADIPALNLSQVLTTIPDFNTATLNDKTAQVKSLRDAFNQVNLQIISAEQKLNELTAISEMRGLVQQTEDSIRQMNFNLISSADTVRRMQSESKGYLTISEEIQNVGLDVARNYDSEINSRKESALTLRREVGDSEELLEVYRQQLAQKSGISQETRDYLTAQTFVLQENIKEKTTQAETLELESQQLSYIRNQAVSQRLVREETQRQYEALKEVSAMQLSLANARYDMGGDLFNVGAIKDARTQAKIAARDIQLWAEKNQGSIDPKVIRDQIAMQKELSDINISKSYLDAIPPLRDFTSGLKDIILMTSNWQEVTKKLIDTLAGLVIDQLVIKPMQNWLAQGIAGVMGWMGDATAPTDVDIPLRKPIEDNASIYVDLNSKLLIFGDRIDNLNQKLGYQVSESTSTTGGGFSGIANTGLGLVSSGLGMFGNSAVFTPSNIVGVSDTVKLSPFTLAMGTDNLDSTKVPNFAFGDDNIEVLTLAMGNDGLGIEPVKLPSFAMGNDDIEIPNFANGLLEGINKAFAKEKAQSGKQPYLAVLHKGEAVLSTLNGDAQLLRSLKASGQWNHLKANPSISNYAYGSEFKSSRIDRNSTANNQTTIYKPEYKIYAQDADSFRKSQSQIEMDSMARMRRARR